MSSVPATESKPTWPKSLWRDTAPDAPQRPALGDVINADICIVGGGFTGLSAALHASLAGAKVVVLEANDVGWGASGRNGGQVIPGLKYEPDELIARFGEDLGERLVQLVGGSADVVFSLCKRFDIDCGAEQSGWISALHASPARKMLESRTAQWQARGADVAWVEGEALANRIGSPLYAAGFLDRRGGKVQPLAYARGLAVAAEQNGARIFVNTPATSVGRAEGGWRVITDHGAVTASQLLLCTNGYTDGLWPGLAQSVIPAFSYQVATVPLSDNVRASILNGGEVVSDTRRLLRYFRTDSEGRLLMGGRGRNLDTSDPRHYTEVIAYLKHTFPQIADVELDYYWGGQVAITTDHLPHLHELAPGVHAALGYNGRGVAMASTMGKVLAERAGGLPESETPFPMSSPNRIPFHRLRRPAIRVASWWRRVADAADERRSN